MPATCSFTSTNFPRSSAGWPGQPSIKLGFEGGSEDAPLYRFGKEDGSHVEFGQFEIEFEFSTAVAGVKAVSRKSELVLNLGKSGNGFLSQILPGEKRIPLNLGLGWSTERGFFIDGGKGNVIKQTNPPPPTPSALTAAPRSSALSRAPQPREGDAANDADLNRVTPVGKTFGPARIQFLSLGLTPESDNGKAKLTLGATIAADIKLGPVTASFDKAGFALTADFAKPDANLSLFDLDFGFQPPKAIGLDIDAKVVHGGGFLDLDREHSQYAGALHLEIEGFASLSALGLLNTNIPGGGFSLLVIITADGFKPIPIGFGFMLAGIGGLLGIHRTVNEDAVQAGVRANTLNSVLAPKDLIRNAPQYLSVIREFFPVARDHYLFGLVAQITWGTPPLVTINLALILELGVRTRFLIMGQVLAILPKKDLDLVRLQMNIFGGVDFDQKRAFLDAVLFDSRLVDRFVITGEMRMRLSWGDQPFFALVRRRTAPGLHSAARPGTDAARGDCLCRLRRFEDPLRLLLRHHLEHRAVRRACRTVRQEIEVQHFRPGRLRRADSVRSVPFRRLAIRLAAVEGGLDQSVQSQLRRRAVRTAAAECQRQGDVRDLVDRLHGVVQRHAGLRPKAAVARARGCGRAAAHGVGRRRQLECRHAGNQRAPGQFEGRSGGCCSHSSVEHVDGEAKRRPAQRADLALRQYASGGRTAGVPHPADRRGSTSFTPDVVRDHFAPAQFRDLSDDEKLSSPSFELLPAGVSVGNNAADCGTPVPAAADFEDIVIPSPPEAPRTTTTIGFPLANRFAEWSAVGMSDASRLGAIRYRAAAVPFTTQAKTFAVKSKTDLSDLQGQ